MTYEVFKVTPSDHPRNGSRVSKYPFSSMEVGDAFDVPVIGASRNTLQATLSASATGYVKRHNQTAKFVTRRLDGFIRVIRIA